MRVIEGAFFRLCLAAVLFSGIAVMAQPVFDVDQKTGKKMILGKCTVDVFADTSFAWFDTEYQAFEMDVAVLDEIPRKFDGYSIVIVFGTWCSDSRREVPRFMKILDWIGFPQSSVTLIGINREKKSPGGESSAYYVTLVPTIMVIKNGVETGRITETPAATLEKDLLSIFKY